MGAAVGRHTTDGEAYSFKARQLLVASSGGREELDASFSGGWMTVERKLMRVERKAHDKSAQAFACVRKVE